MRNNYEERAKKFIRQLDSYINTSVLTQDDCEIITMLFNLKHNRNVIMKHGLTRVAFITSDYVVKIDCPEGPNDIYNFGGCEDEKRIYARAEKDGFAYMFAKITHYCYNGNNYYIMPRVNNIGKTFYDANDYMSMDELAWLHEVGIRDLHNANYGWYKNHIVIFDYAACRYR